MIEVGKPIAIIETDGEASGSETAPAEAQEESPVEKAEAILETAISTASSNGA